MAGQGDTIRRIARVLTESGWDVVFVCVPNTPHVAVVPIPVKNGSAKQRYPDIAAYRGDITRLLEVEMSLTEGVANDIQERFTEFIGALRDPQCWCTWREHVKSQTRHVLPKNFVPRCDLVVCRNLKPDQQRYVEILRRVNIRVSNASSFEA